MAQVKQKVTDIDRKVETLNAHGVANALYVLLDVTSVPRGGL
jgi:hypothetical protein